MSEVKKSALFGKLQKRVKGSVAQMKKKEPKARGQSLPGGIRNGIARLSSCKFGETNNDTKDPFVSYTGIVHEPPEHAGQRATTRITFKDTTSFPNGKTVDQRIEEFFSDVQLLGGDISECENVEDVFDVLEALCQEAPFYKFSTMQMQATPQNPNPMVLVFCGGAAPDYEPADDGETVEETPEPTPPKKTPAKPKAATPKPEPEPEPEATEGDDEWAGPQVDEQYYYRPNPKAAKKLYTVVEVDDENRKVTLQSEDGKSLKGVSFDKLEGEE